MPRKYGVRGFGAIRNVFPRVLKIGFKRSYNFDFVSTRLAATIWISFDQLAAARASDWSIFGIHSALNFAFSWMPAIAASTCSRAVDGIR